MSRKCRTGHARQALRDALKTLRETGEAWVTWNGERFRLAPPDTPGEGDHWPGLVRRGNLVEVWELVGKDAGGRARCGIMGWRANPSRVLARIVERHPRLPA